MEHTGGFETDDSGKFLRKTTEIAAIRNAMNAVESAPTRPEKAEKAKELLELLLFSKSAIRRRSFREVARQKLEYFWDVPEMYEHRRLISQVIEYINSIPESEIVGGKLIKTRKRKQTKRIKRRKTYRK